MRASLSKLKAVRHKDAKHYEHSMPSDNFEINILMKNREKRFNRRMMMQAQKKILKCAVAACNGIGVISLIAVFLPIKMSFFSEIW